jgi:hypothetical protein
MTKLLAILIILVLLFVGWKVIESWQETPDGPGTDRGGAAARVVSPGQLPGMPPELQPSLDAAEAQGAGALANWLRTYDRYLQDPRKAWIELDYCVMIARDDPSEARRVFRDVRDRTPPSSPVWPRIKELERSYE